MNGPQNENGCRVGFVEDMDFSKITFSQVQIWSFLGPSGTFGEQKKIKQTKAFV